MNNRGEMVMGNCLDFRDEGVALLGLPQPISVNDYCNRRYPTKEKKRLVADFGVWSKAVGGERGAEKIRRHLFGDRANDFVERRSTDTIRIEWCWGCNFICKNGRPKVMDPSNYIKCMEDLISNFIGINDCYFRDFDFKSIHVPREEDYFFMACISRPDVFEL